MKLKIALDLDDTIFDWRGEYSKIFGDITKQPPYIITRNVKKLRYNKKFWSNLPLIEKPDFIPHIYSTKRINSKDYTKSNLSLYDLPIKPIYQTISQSGNKVDIIKGVSNLLIDDSVFNVKQALNVGFPALLIIREHNKNHNIKHYINSLSIKEIKEKYNCLIQEKYILDQYKVVI